jgi:hypothetical protein
MPGERQSDSARARASSSGARALPTSLLGRRPAIRAGSIRSVPIRLL